MPSIIHYRIYHHNCLYNFGGIDLSLDQIVKWATINMQLHGYDRAVARFWDEHGELKDRKLYYRRDPALGPASEDSRSIYFMVEALETLWCKGAGRR